MVGSLVSILAVTSLAADPPIRLRESGAVGGSTRVVIALKGEGLFKPGEPAATSKVEARPLALKVETRLEFVEKTLAVGKDGAATRAFRRVERAGASINGEVRATSATLRPEVMTLLAELREGQVVVASPGGPLTRAELEVVQGAGDPLALAALLPTAAVAPGETWTVGADAARALSGYDTLDDNALKATLTRADAARAVVGLEGSVRGSLLGGSGTITLNGAFTFDRAAGRVEGLEVDRAEVRRPGPIEAGLDIKSTLTVDRRAAELPAELGEAATAGLPTAIDRDLESLLFRSLDGRYTLVHDRDWHIGWDGDRQAALKRLAAGVVVAQCTLSTGPDAGKGRHQDPAQLRDDIRRAAGPRFVAILGEGEVEGLAEGNYRYKVAIQGREGTVDVLWYYYLIASRRGDQVLAIFTLAADQRERFGDGDLRLIGSFAWTGPAAAP